MSRHLFMSLDREHGRIYGRTLIDAIFGETVNRQLISYLAEPEEIVLCPVVIINASRRVAVVACHERRHHRDGGRDDLRIPQCDTQLAGGADLELNCHIDITD